MASSNTVPKQRACGMLPSVQKLKESLSLVNLCLFCQSTCCSCHVSYVYPPACLVHRKMKKEWKRGIFFSSYEGGKGKKQRGEAEGEKHLIAESGLRESAAVIT